MAVPGEGSYGGMSEAQRNAIVQALLAQAYQQQGPASYMSGDSVASDPYAQMADPSDPDAQAPGYGTPADIAGPVVASPGDQTGPSPAGLAAIAANAQSSNLNSDNIGGNLADPGGRGLAAAMAAPVGTPAGYYGGLLSPDNAVTATPAQPDAFDQGLTFGGRNIAGHNISPAFDAFEGAQVAPSPTSVVAGRFGAMQAPAAQPDQGLTFGGRNIAGHNIAPAFNAFEGASQATGGNQGAAIAADIAGLSALNADVNAAVNAGYGPGPVAGPTAGPVAGPSTGNVAADVGVGIGLGISGGFGGATGDGTSGSTAASDAAGVGTSGNATGISGGPGGTGEGGANTGEGGGGGGGGGGDGGK